MQKGRLQNRQLLLLSIASIVWMSVNMSAIDDNKMTPDHPDFYKDLDVPEFKDDDTSAFDNVFIEGMEDLKRLKVDETDNMTKPEFRQYLKDKRENKKKEEEDNKWIFGDMEPKYYLEDEIGRIPILH